MSDTVTEIEAYTDALEELLKSREQADPKISAICRDIRISDADSLSTIASLREDRERLERERETAENERDEAQDNAAELQARIDDMEAQAQMFARILEDLDISAHDLELVENSSRPLELIMEWAH